MGGFNGLGGINGVTEFSAPARISNVFAYLNSPGQWYLDSLAHRLYYIPLPGQSPPAAQVTVPVLQSLLEGQGTLTRPVHNIVFRGLTFSYNTWLGPSGNNGFAEMQANFTLTGAGASASEGTCQWSLPRGTCPFAAWTATPAAVSFTAAQHITFLSDVFQHIGDAGLSFSYGSSGNLIEGCIFTDISASGIQLGGTHDPEPSYVGAGANEINAHNTIQDNYIHNVADQYHGGVGIWVGYTQYTTISHNQIDKLPYSGISFGWGGWHTNTFTPNNFANVNEDNTIANNAIFDVMQVLQDGGPIYTNGVQGTSIEHGLTERANVAWNSNADFMYYNDEASSYITLTKNVEFGGPLFANGGCNTIGHILIDNNYWAQPFGGYICAPPPIDV